MSDRWRPGQLVEGRYEILCSMGGGMGAVFVCRDLSRGQKVALKTFKDRYLLDSEVVRRFSEEAATWIRLGAHANIVRAYAVDNIDFRPYLVLEYVEAEAGIGPELSAYIAAGALAVEKALRFAKQLCSGMIHAALAGSSEGREFVHADLKPSNLLIREGSTLKISDFGLARCGEADARFSGWGSRAYMAPEQLEGQPADLRTDIYAFGVVLYEMLAGERPGRGAAGPSRPAGRRDGCPPLLEETVMACLEEDPTKRLRDFPEILRCLEEAFPEDGTLDRGRIRGLASKDRLRTLESAVSLSNLERHGEALALFDAALRIEGDDDERYIALCGRGSSLGGLGRAEEAAEALDGAIALFPERPHALVMRANLLNDEGRHAEAVALYDSAIASDSGYPIAYYNRGLCRERMGDAEGSLSDFDRAIALGFDEALTNRGGSLKRLGRIEEALRDFEGALERNPRNAIALGNAGAIYGELGRTEEALAFLALAADIRPDYILPYFYRAELKARLGRLEEAIADFETALAIEAPNAPVESGLKYSIPRGELDRIRSTIYHDCAITLLRLGETRKAKEYLLIFVGNAPAGFEVQLEQARYLLARIGGEIVF